MNFTNKVSLINKMVKVASKYIYVSQSEWTERLQNDIRNKFEWLETTDKYDQFF